ncbi:hypothetical protein HALDL1_08385 [Halobacterium sp. DL1]|jgi:hypothetical protein|nr:hypothetical protein HALDL1_08385 [Halobacterium sp. DL1]
MSEDPLFCENCEKHLAHEEVHRVDGVPQLDPETFEMENQVAEVYQCRGCGLVLGFDAPA